MNISATELITLKRLVDNHHKNPKDIGSRISLDQYTGDLAAKYKFNRAKSQVNLETGEITESIKFQRKTIEPSIGNRLSPSECWIVFRKDDPKDAITFLKESSADRYLQIRKEQGLWEYLKVESSLWHNPEITTGPTIREDVDERGICVECGLFASGTFDGQPYCGVHGIEKEHAQ